MILNEYLQVLDYYGINKPNNIYKIKKSANHCMLHKMCKSSENDSKYKKVILVMLRRKMASYNKKNIVSNTMKNKSRLTHNKTRVRSPISYLCT